MSRTGALGVLGDIIAAAQAATGRSLGELTVLSGQRDPYRLATAAHWRNAEWLAEAIERIKPPATIHLRGLHYLLIGRVALPGGKPYTNTDETWIWLSEKAAMAARFLGTVPFSRFEDQRNAEPNNYTTGTAEAIFGTWVMLDSDDLLDFAPSAPAPHLLGTMHRQAWRLAIIGEKSGLAPLLAPLAQMYEATLALPNGEISTTMTERLILDAAADGRPLAVIYLHDCDPSGWQMPVSFARKAQAVIDLGLDVRLRVHPVALRPAQVLEWGLPSTPLKDSERRADRWKAAMGVEQTEIDAAVALAPDLLRQAVEGALDAYFDHGAAARGQASRAAWLGSAGAAIEARVAADDSGAALHYRIERDAAMTALEAAREHLSAAAGAAYEALAGLELPPEPEIVVGVADEAALPYLIDTDEGYVATTDRLREHRGYAAEAEPCPPPLHGADT